MKYRTPLEDLECALLTQQETAKSDLDTSIMERKIMTKWEKSERGALVNRSNIRGNTPVYTCGIHELRPKEIGGIEHYDRIQVHGLNKNETDDLAQRITDLLMEHGDKPK